MKQTELISPTQTDKFKYLSCTQLLKVGAKFAVVKGPHKGETATIESIQSVGVSHAVVSFDIIRCPASGGSDIQVPWSNFTDESQLRYLRIWTDEEEALYK